MLTSYINAIIGIEKVSSPTANKAGQVCATTSKTISTLGIQTTTEKTGIQRKPRRPRTRTSRETPAWVRPWSVDEVIPDSEEEGITNRAKYTRRPRASKEFAAWVRPWRIDEVLSDSEEERLATRAKDTVHKNEGMICEQHIDDGDKQKGTTDWSVAGPCDEDIRHVLHLLHIKPNLEFSEASLRKMGFCTPGELCSGEISNHGQDGERRDSLLRYIKMTILYIQDH